MTVKELIKELQKLPKNATVITQGYYDCGHITESNVTSIEAIKGQKNGCVFVKIIGEYEGLDGDTAANYGENVWTEIDEFNEIAVAKEHFDTLFEKSY